MALPASIPPTRARSTGTPGPDPLAPALRLAVDRHHPSCGDIPAGGPCGALANCPLAPACAPDASGPSDAPAPARRDDDPVVLPMAPRPSGRGGGATHGAVTPIRARVRAVVPFRRRDDRGQATAEYGLVILVAGLIALGVIAWARGTGSFTDLFESVIDSLTAGF